MTTTTPRRPPADVESVLTMVASYGEVLEGALVSYVGYDQASTQPKNWERFVATVSLVSGALAELVRTERQAIAAEAST